MSILHAPTGRLIEGHVLDCARKPFERALRDYDKQLYIRWNPKKLKGWGCWEIRRRPAHKTAIFQGEHAGVSYYRLMTIEFNDVSHILDCAFLNYDQLRKLKQMDTWGKGNFAENYEKREAEYIAAQKAKAREHLKYSIKHHGSAMRDLYEMVRSGVSPAQILLAADWTQK